MGVADFLVVAIMLRRLATRSVSSIAVRSPRDGLVFAEIPEMTAEQVEACVDSAQACLTSAWSRPSAVEDRAGALRAIGAELRERTEELANLETLDCGKPLSESRADLAFCADVCDYYADLAPAVLVDEPIKLPDEAFLSRIVPAPAGVAACITPWNYPLMQAVAKVAPALAAGCPVLLKPSPLASLTCIELGKMARGVLPAGALSVITGGPPSGGDAGGVQRLVSHPRVDLLSFTGSGRGGRQLLRESADVLRRSSLELGGKGALVVFEVRSAPGAALTRLLTRPPPCLLPRAVQCGQ